MLALATVVLTLVFRSNRVRTREAAAVELDRVRGTVQAGNVQVARQDLQKFIQSFGNTPSGKEAKLLLGQVQLQSGEAQNAIPTLKPLADDVESTIGYNAALMLASAYELNKQNDQADRTYLRIADQARFDYQTREALDRAARLRDDSGNHAGAIELYERIIATFDLNDVDSTPERNAYEMRLSELRAQAGKTERS